MKQRLVCLTVAACLLLTLLPAAPAPSSGVPVYDGANYAQALIDHLMRLFEIAQRVIEIANQLKELEFWFYAMLKLDEVPYREEILAFLEVQGELLKEFDDLKGQYQALSHSLEDTAHEFDITFPGWRAVSEMAAGASLQIQSEAGEYEFDSPLEYARYQSSRSLQAVRQTLAAMAHDQASLIASQEHLEELKEKLRGVEGHQQALEMQTSFAALSAEQLVALRQSQQTLALTVSNLGAHRLNAEMQHAASQNLLADQLREALLGQFGVLVPEHTGENGVSPYPTWVIPF